MRSIPILAGFAGVTRAAELSKKNRGVIPFKISRIAGVFKKSSRSGQYF